MSKDDHKIDADDRSVFDVLNERKYTVDYFQREYSWEQKHIAQLVTDLTSTFLDVYSAGDPRASVEHYNNYYLGPFVVSSKDGTKSIIDGQQRLTSLTLFLIFLNNLQKDLGGKESIEPLVFSEKYGNKSFNIQVEERKACLERLFLDGIYEVKPDDDLVLLPQGTNQSYGAMTYAQKIEHYLKENLFVKSLHRNAYVNNPNFVGMARNLALKFKAHDSFTKADIDERQALVQSICEAIWGEVRSE